ncbi:MAG: FIST signal transduction protein [Verrucomicrobiales bacterium]
MDSSNRAVSKVVLSTFDEAAISRAAKGCHESLGAKADLVVAFVTPDFQPRLEEFVELVQVFAQAPRVVGCSASGVIGTAEENEGVSGFSLLALSLPRTGIEVTLVREAASSPVPPSLDDEDPAAIALFHPWRFDPQNWLRRWNATFPAVPVIGGLASGGSSEQEIFLFTEAGATDAAGLMVRFRGGVRIEALVSQGCRPIGRAEPITEARDNYVSRLGGDPAYSVLKEAVEGLMNEGAEIVPGSIHAGLAVSEYIEELRRGDFLVRNLLGADAESGRVHIGASVEIGRTLQFQFRDRDTADEDLRSQCGALRDAGGSGPFAALLFSCGGRGQHFFGVPNHDAGILAEAFGRHPMAGFFCNGEIGPVGVANYLHGYTASAALFYAAD